MGGRLLASCFGPCVNFHCPGVVIHTLNSAACKPPHPVPPPGRFATTLQWLTRAVLAMMGGKRLASLLLSQIVDHNDRRPLPALAVAAALQRRVHRLAEDMLVVPITCTEAPTISGSGPVTILRSFVG